MAIATESSKFINGLGIPQGPLLEKLLPVTQLVEKQFQYHINEYTRSGVLICESDPLKFIATVLVALSYQVPVFLGNPQWRSAEWDQVLSLSKFNILGEFQEKHVIINQIQNSQNQNQNLEPFKGFLMIPTGGTTGPIRFAIHNWNNLLNSARATQAFLNLDKLNAYNTLPLYHVSGLMPVIRALVTGGDVEFFDYKEWLEENSNVPILPQSILSLVSAQLEELLKNPRALQLLKNFHTIFIGGGPCGHSVLEKARGEQLPIALVYGMTETASMVCAISPPEFLAGNYSKATPLPGVTPLIDDEGSICIQSSTLCYGYYPQPPVRRSVWRTQDKGVLHEARLEVLGRSDRILITGGEKVDPQEVEAAILSTGLAQKVIVTSVPDPKWGQRIVCAYVPRCRHDISQLTHQLKSFISNYKLPKEWIQMDQIPTLPTGKIDYVRIQKLFTDKTCF